MRDIQLFFLRNNTIAILLVATVILAFIILTIVDAIRKKRCDLSITSSVITGIIGAVVLPLMINFIIVNPLSDEMETIYDEAQELYNNGDYSLAASKTNELIEMQPTNARWHGLLSTIRYSQGDYEASLTEAEEALSYSSDNGDYHRLQAKALYRLNRLDEALDALKLAIDFQEDDYRNYEWLGFISEKQEDYEAQKTAYEKANELKPDDDRIIYQLSRAYAWIGEYSNALDEIDKAISINPEEVVYPKMQSLIKQLIAVENNENDVDLVVDLGIGFLNIGEYRRAIKQFQRSVMMDPENAAYRYNRGVCYQKLEEYALAKEDIAAAMKMDPEKENYSKRYRLINAEESVRNSPEDINSVISLGYACYEMDYLNDAIAHFKKAKSLLIKNNRNIEYIESVINALSVINATDSPNEEENANMSYRMGLLMYDIEDYNNALKEGALAAKLVPTNAYYYDLEACALRALGRNEEALKLFEKAHEIAPDEEDFIKKIENTKKLLKK